MLFGRLKKKKSSQAAKSMTARQMWTLTNFQFLEAHLTIHMDACQLGKVVVPVLPADVEEEEGGDAANADAASLMSARSSSTSSGKQVDEAILTLAEWLNLNTGVQDRLGSAVQESSNLHLAFCQWMGLEACKLSEELWTRFMQESFQMIQLHQQSAFVCLSSAPPVMTPPSLCQQMPHT